MSASDSLHPQLFDPATTRAQKPGEMGMDQWIAHHGDNVVYHGTFNPDWRSSPVTHSGTLGQAATRLDTSAEMLQRSSEYRKDYYNPGQEEYDEDIDGPYGDEDDDRPREQEHTGRVFATRLTTPPAAHVYGDMDANTGEVDYQLEGGQTPAKSILHSAGMRNQWSGQVAAHLEAGTPVKYRNAVEGDNFFDTGSKGPPAPYDPFDRNSGKPPVFGSGSPDPISVSAPRGSFKTWEDDVLEPDSGASTNAIAFAKQRGRTLDSGSLPASGSVPFPGKAPMYRGMYQQTLGDAPGADAPGRLADGSAGPSQWHDSVPVHFPHRLRNSIQFTATD